MKFECLAEKCPSSCCANLKMEPVMKSMESWGIAPFQSPIRGTIKDNEILEDQVFNNYLQVSESQVKPGKRYLPIMIARFSNGDYAWYGRQLAWEESHCSEYKDGLCSDYDNRPYQCIVYPMSQVKGEYKIDLGCPVMSKVSEKKLFLPKHEIEKIEKYFRLMDVMGNVLFTNAFEEDVDKVFMVHPETKDLSKFPPKYHLLVDVEDRFPVTRVTVIKGKEKRTVGINLRKLDSIGRRFIL